MKIKAILRSLCCALLLAALLTAMGCGLIANKKNTVASSTYLVDPLENALIRQDFNADGKMLGRTLLEWDTLQPKRYVSVSHDWTYEYGRGGAVRATIACGAPLTLAEQKNNTLYGRGYDILGGAHSVEYTLDESGCIVSELYTKGQKPYGERVYTYGYDDLGRLSSLSMQNVSLLWDTQERVYTYEYTADAVVLSCDGEPYATLAINENGMPVSFTKAGEDEATYTWKYDEVGRPVPTTEDARWNYDEDGRLISVQEKDGSGEWMTMQEYRFDKSGDIVRSVKTTVDGQRTSVSTLEFSDGRRSHSTSEHLITDAQGKATTNMLNETVYDSYGRYEEGASYHIAEDGTKVLSQKAGFTWDEQGRCTGNYTRHYYDDGKMRDEESVTYAYTESGEINAVTEGEIHLEEGYSYDQKTTDYYNEEFVKTRGTYELIWLEPDENGDMLRSMKEYEYDDKGENIAHSISYGYKNDELVSEVEQENDFVFGNGYSATYHRKEYENGKLTREYERTEDEEWGSACTEQIYVDGVLREDSRETQEYGQYKTEVGTSFSRPVEGVYRYYDATGKHERTEERAYTFYEDGTRKSTDMTIKDPSGKVIEAYLEEYDEQGELTSRTNK